MHSTPIERSAAVPGPLSLSCYVGCLPRNRLIPYLVASMLTRRFLWIWNTACRWAYNFDCMPINSMSGSTERARRILELWTYDGCRPINGRVQWLQQRRLNCMSFPAFASLYRSWPIHLSSAVAATYRRNLPSNTAWHLFQLLIHHFVSITCQL